MTDNRYRRGSPPGSRRYHDPRASTGMVFSSSFDPTYPRGSVDPHPHTRHASIYDTQPVKKYTYPDTSHGPSTSTTHYAVRPRNNSALPGDVRRPLSMIVKNTSPTRRPVVSNSSRDDPRSPVGSHASIRDDSSRYLVPASSHSNEHHQRHYSATRADAERINGASRSSRSRPEYHQAGGYSSKPLPVNRVKDDDYSYTGPREQFARDFPPSRPPERRNSNTRRERPASVYDLGGYKDLGNGRKELGPPPTASSRQLDRIDRSDGARLSIRPPYESEPERGDDLPKRRHSVRVPVVHQAPRGDDYRDYPPRDEMDMRPPARPRRDRIEEEDIPFRPRRDRMEDDLVVPVRPRKERIEEEDVPLRPRRDRMEDDLVVPVRPRKERSEEEEIPVRPRRDRVEDELQLRPRRDRVEEEPALRPRRERLDEEEPAPRLRRERVEGEDPVAKMRPRDAEREMDRERDLPKEPDRVRERDYPRDRDRERERDHDKDRLRPAEKGYKHSDRREDRSRDNSPEDSGHGKAVAAGLGGIAVAGLAGAAIKNSQKPEEASDSDSRRERKRREQRHRERENELDPRGYDQALDRKVGLPVDDRGDGHHQTSRQDESANESLDDEHERRRHRRRKHRGRDEADIEPVVDPRVAPESVARDTLEAEDEPRRRRRHSRVREPDPDDLDRRTISPGEEDDDRPRRVQLVEPVKDKEESKPKGILKAPRVVPFPEDPHPTREGVAPLKDAGKDGVPASARWTKISRVMVNPEALEKANERFEQRDDYVIVLRVLTREEIEKLALKTREIRGKREREWQEELEKRKTQDSTNPRTYGEGEEYEDEENRPRPMLDQVPANPSFDPRIYTNPEARPNYPVAGMPVPDIKLENVEAANYSMNV